jgi:type IV pilus assembly protein PilW
MSLRNARGQRTARHKVSGLSLVELMVGIAIGLIVVAAAALAVTGQLSDNRRLLAETQLQQDLRAAVDIITRELRRSGAQRDAEALDGVWRPEMSTTKHNTFAEYQYLPSVNTSPTRYDYKYQVPGNGSTQLSAFRLQNNTVQQCLPGNGCADSGIWQEVTDSSAVKVTAFSITPSDQTPIQLACPKLCPDGTQACWPTVQVRELLISITAESKNYAEVQRTMSSRVRVRNDYVKFWTPPNPPPANYDVNQMCPP